MTVDSILDSTSFSTLDDAGQKAVRDLFDKVYHGGKKLALDHLKLFRKRTSLPLLLATYSKKLNITNPASFKFLYPHQRALLEQELLFAFYIFSAQYQLDESEHRRQNIQELIEQIKMCADLLNKLREAPPLGAEESPEKILRRATSDSEKHLKYLGLKIVAPFISESMQEFSSGKTVVIKKWMGFVNGRRLYWVWGGGFLNSVIAMLPDDFANKPQTQKVVSAPSPVTGYMSWTLYYTRFGINLSLLLKHTIAGPWMSKEERQIPVWERFKTQWNQRKFALLNDSIWGLANMACFFWLIGSGMLGYSGNVLTAVLLLMDTCLVAWHFWEESTQHNKDIARYERDIKLMQEKIAGETDEENKKKWQQQLSIILKDKKQCEFDWQYKKYGLMNDLVYAAALLAAFCVWCCFFFPPAGIAVSTSLILGVVGAGLCFVVSTIYAAVSGRIDIAKSKQTDQLAKQECIELLKQFNGCNDENIKKQLYLDIKRLVTSSEHQARVIYFQKMQMVRGILVDALIPPLIFISFMFMPFGVGLGVMAAGVALAIISHFMIKRLEPKAAKLPAFDEAEYAKFASKPELIKLKHEGAPGFFSKKPSIKLSAAPAENQLIDPVASKS